MQAKPTLDDCIRIAAGLGVREHGPLSRNWSFNDTQLMKFVEEIRNWNAARYMLLVIDVNNKVAKIESLPTNVPGKRNIQDMLSYSVALSAKVIYDLQTQEVLKDPGNTARAVLEKLPPFDSLEEATPVFTPGGSLKNVCSLLGFRTASGFYVGKMFSKSAEDLGSDYENYSLE